ncbi:MULTISPECIES: rhodanese-like domain-containing protein [unclassified Frondihabitans]|uniref:rhodanese-like domain-containing protein n=1 Tax=unclassified Frondihabitans TaxID=2626248 RepID=UPI000F4FA30D|nr:MULTISPECIES: rhodanese-like domain-containing protein [unclassified Frondihabitans]RPE77631.1 rhodanese-related sulfurtransferase [Frondihabitans sp. PhB153]RPF07908.1 rhodanese-related sulfurtransferase [Frondihabitans sp. PhB161]
MSDTVTVTELNDATDPVLVDVREPNEYATGHVPGAINIPLDDLASRVEDVPDAEPVYVICQAGIRSARGADILIDLGYQAVSVDGGTQAWIEHDLPLDTE